MLQGWLSEHLFLLLTTLIKDMNSKIEAYSIVNGEVDSTLIDLLAKAAKQCLIKSGITINDVDLIINSSIYSEDYISEPAVASLVQNRLNNGNAANKQFSFDLQSGGGGVIQAMQIADTMIKDGNITTALLVAGDVQPKKGDTAAFNVNNGAGAIIIIATEEDCGFIKFHFETYEEFLEMDNRFLSWEKSGVVFNHQKSEEYSPLCADLIVQSIAKSGIEIKADSMGIVFSQYPEDISIIASNQLNIKVNTINHAPLYSAGIIQSLLANDNKKEILFVNAGPGITISVAHYKNIS